MSSRTASTDSIQDISSTPSTTSTTLLSTDTRKRMKGFQDLPDELLELIAGYLSRGDMHACVLVNHSLSQSFIPHLWRNLNITTCYLSRPWTDHNGLFARLKAASIDSGALARNGRYIRVLKNVSPKWLPFFGTEVCPFLEEVAVCTYESPGKEDEEDTWNRVARPPADDDYDGKGEEEEAHDNVHHMRAAREERRELAPLLDFLQQQQRQLSGLLRRLSLGRTVLWIRTESVYLELMRSIPEGVEELRLYQWDGKCFGGESRISRWPVCVAIDDFTDFQDDYARMRATATVDAAATIAESRNTVSTPESTLTATPGSHSDILPNIKKLTLEHSVLDGAGVDRLWSWFPYLESLALYGSSILNLFEFTKLLRARCPLLSGLHISSISNKSMGAFPGLGYAVVLCASLRGWKTLTLSSDALINTNAFWQTSVLHHVDTLETLYLEGFEMADWGSIVGRILDTAPRLKRLYIMPTRIHGMVWQPTKLSETLNWACQDLEVLRIRYSFVGRNSDRRTKHDQFQQQLYHQLGRLTKLKELILGDMEDDEFVFDEDDCDDYDSHDAPFPSYEEDVRDDYDFKDEPASSSSKEEHTQNRYRTTRRTIPQPKFLPESLACPEMTLASGMGALKDLKQLRRVGLRNLEHHGFLASEEDRAWVKENWPLFHHGYRNDVWKSFRRW